MVNGNTVIWCFNLVFEPETTLIAVVIARTRDQCV